MYTSTAFNTPCRVKGLYTTFKDVEHSYKQFKPKDINSLFKNNNILLKHLFFPISLRDPNQLHF